MDILDNWEMYKCKVKSISKSFSTLQSNERKTMSKVCNEMRRHDPDPEILKNTEEKE